MSDVFANDNEKDDVSEEEEDAPPQSEVRPIVRDPPPLTREQRRSRRKREVRAKTINISRFAKSALELGRILHPEMEVERPSTRKDCAELPRPCPFVSCRHHLYLDVSPRTGSIKLNFPDLEVWELGQSCSLDLAEQGPLGAEELGAVMNLTRERVRQIERESLERTLGTLEATNHASWKTRA